MSVWLQGLVWLGISVGVVAGCDAAPCACHQSSADQAQTKAPDLPKDYQIIHVDTFTDLVRTKTQECLVISNGNRPVVSCTSSVSTPAPAREL